MIRIWKDKLDEFSYTQKTHFASCCEVREKENKSKPDLAFMTVNSRLRS
jgi:hypothetical protein